MSEQTPEFGGLVAGIAANRSGGVNDATDRLAREINSFADALAKFTSDMNNARRGLGGGGSGPVTQQSSRGNGGGATFGGQHRDDHSTGRTSWGFRQTGGAHAAGMPPTPNGGGASTTTYAAPTGPTSHRGPGVIAQNRGMVARGVGVAALGASTVFTRNHYSNMVTANAMASMYGTDNTQAAQENVLRGQFTAHDNGDLWGKVSVMGQRGGVGMNSAGWNRLDSQIQSYSAVDPSISNTQAAKAIVSTQTVGSLNTARALGFGGSAGDPRAMAKQLVERIGGRAFKTREQVDAAFGQRGSAIVTLDSYAAAGAIPAEARTVIETEMKRILYAQVAGMNYDKYNRLATASVGGDTSAAKAARAELKEAGVADDALVEGTRRKAGRALESEAAAIEGFETGMRNTTETLGEFRDMLNKILNLGGGRVGEWYGLWSGATGTAGVAGGGGDGPSSMSAASRNYDAITGAASAKAGFGSPAGLGGAASRVGGGGANVASTGAGANVAARQYGLGNVKPHVAKAAGILGPMFGIKSIGGWRAGSKVANSDHPKGLALDLMCSKSQGDRLAAYAVANADQLNISYVIWYQRIWSRSQGGKWSKMGDRGSPTDNHMDHVHISFLANPTGKLSDLSGGGGDVASAGGSLGSAGAASTPLGAGANAPNNGIAAAGGFSEAAALGLGPDGYARGTGGGGLFGSGGGGGANSAGGYGGGGGGGPRGNYGTAGGPGSLRIGTFNALFTNNARRTAADFKKISNKADVIGWQEMHGKHASQFASWMKENTNWTYYGSKGGDTAVSWNTDKYRALEKGVFDILDRMNSKSGIRNIPSSSAYVLLQDKQTGSKFWAVSNHLQAHATTRGGKWADTQRTQLKQLETLYARLRKTGIPVINVGDWNNKGLNLGGDKYGAGIDKIFAQGANITGGGSIGAGQTNSDHPFLYANINLPGSKGGGGAGVSGNGGTVQSNIALGKALAAKRGWKGAQWDALFQLWQRESGWRHDADNPTSSAYGIPQALTQTHGLGDKYKNDPRTQILWGLNYIAGRYGNPASAWQFWQRNNWYRSGAHEIKQDEVAQLHQGEMVLNAKDAAALRAVLSGGTGPGGSGGGVVFQQGAIVVQVHGGIDKKSAEEGGRRIVDAIVEDRRFKALAEGRV